MTDSLAAVMVPDSVDSLMMAMGRDSILAATAAFKKTLSLMHLMIVNTEPVMSCQLDVIESQRFMGNLFMFIFFVLIVFVLFVTHKKAQGVKRFLDVKIEKKWLITMFVFFALSLGIFNLYPGFILAEMNRKISSKEAIEAAQARLFGWADEDGGLPENTVRPKPPIKEEE